MALPLVDHSTLNGLEPVLLSVDSGHMFCTGCARIGCNTRRRSDARRRAPAHADGPVNMLVALRCEV